MVQDIQDHKVKQDLLDPKVTLNQVNLVPQGALENQVPMAFPVIKVNLAKLDQWVPEVHLVHMEHLDRLEFLLLENLDKVACLGQWDTEESLV